MEYTSPCNSPTIMPFGVHGICVIDRTATTNPAVISHRQACRSALSSVIAEAAGPSEAPEAGPARTYGAYSSSGQPQSQTDMWRTFPGYPMRWKPSHRPLAIGSGPAGVLPPLPEIGHHQNCRSTRQSSVISGSAGRLMGACHQRRCRVGRVGTVFAKLTHMHPYRLYHRVPLLHPTFPRL